MFRRAERELSGRRVRRAGGKRLTKARSTSSSEKGGGTKKSEIEEKHPSLYQVESRVKWIIMRLNTWYRFICLEGVKNRASEDWGACCVPEVWNTSWLTGI